MRRITILASLCLVLAACSGTLSNISASAPIAAQQPAEVTTTTTEAPTNETPTTVPPTSEPVVTAPAEETFRQGDEVYVVDSDGEAWIVSVGRAECGIGDFLDHDPGMKNLTIEVLFMAADDARVATPFEPDVYLVLDNGDLVENLDAKVPWGPRVSDLRIEGYERLLGWYRFEMPMNRQTVGLQAFDTEWTIDCLYSTDLVGDAPPTEFGLPFESHGIDFNISDAYTEIHSGPYGNQELFWYDITVTNWTDETKWVNLAGLTLNDGRGAPDLRLEFPVDAPAPGPLFVEEVAPGATNSGWVVTGYHYLSGRPGTLTNILLQINDDITLVRPTYDD